MPKTTYIDPKQPVSECATVMPGVDNPPEVCTPRVALEKIAEVILPTEKGGDAKEIVEELKEKTKCDTESCVIETPEVKKILGLEATLILKTKFKIPGPSASTELLSNFNIDDAMSQLPRMYPHFLAIPFHMIDFEKYDTILAKLTAKSVKEKNKTQFGVVLNTDKTNQGGTHWFAIFCDLIPGELEFFNSSGNMPVDTLAIWMAKFCRQAEVDGIPLKERVVSKTRHQHGYTECGVYSLYYIFSRVKGVTPEFFETNLITDDMMIKMREHLFRPDGKKGKIDRRGLPEKPILAPVPVTQENIATISAAAESVPHNW